MTWVGDSEPSTSTSAIGVHRRDVGLHWQGEAVRLLLLLCQLTMILIREWVLLISLLLHTSCLFYFDFLKLHNAEFSINARLSGQCSQLHERHLTHISLNDVISWDGHFMLSWNLDGPSLPPQAANHSSAAWRDSPSPLAFSLEWSAAWGGGEEPCWLVHWGWRRTPMVHRAR